MTIHSGGIAPTDNKKLIEEARYEYKNPAPGSVGDLIRRLADALEAVEKAHTPTDDEREALIARLEDEVAYRVRTAVALYKGGHDFEAQVTEGRASVRKIAAGFRRSEVPEPSAEEPECFAEKPDWPEHWTSNDKLRDLHARWHEQKGNLIGRDECGYERCEFWDAAEFTLRLADVRIAGREPQGEPSDAREKVIDALVMTRLSDFAGTDIRIIEQAADAVLAALRAAGGVR